ncbi:putative GTP-binding protein [Ralstonia phage RP31]|uniref:Putative GTP-binding protein n=1 Tax=Ralstonia phage RP31 TaxID=1923890 RepID=A0A1L7N1H4_9CAUD|nr:putative GTP-binding protein [Ralstonia phage RP31]
MIVDWAEENGEPCFKFPAKWDELGKAAGHIRNAEMRTALTHLLVFWDGESKGTKEMIDNTIKMGINNVFLVSVKPDEWWIDYQRRKREKKFAARQ